MAKTIGSRELKIRTVRAKWRGEFLELLPLEYLLRIMNKRGVSRQVSIAAARAALPYCHAKLRPVAPEQFETDPEQAREAFETCRP